MNKAYDRERINSAISEFEKRGLSPAEGLIAAGQLLVSQFKQFRETAPDFRANVGDEVAKNFAHQELNDLIYDLQDIIPPAIRTYNSLLRDPDQKNEAPDGR